MPCSAALRTVVRISRRYAESTFPRVGSSRDHDTRRRTTLKPWADIDSKSASVTGTVGGRSGSFSAYSAMLFTLTPRRITWRFASSRIAGRAPRTAWSAGSSADPPSSGRVVLDRWVPGVGSVELDVGTSAVVL